ncbi:MAG TPA: hypothetical protein ENJ00_05935 [Phycisphaerales bacterium]|nr:hypothetical protein [Phycisphaerales bacterium]
MKIGSTHIRTVEPTQPTVLPARRPDLAPVPFDRYLRKINRESDTLELSRTFQDRAAAPARRDGPPSLDPDQPTSTPPKPIVRSERVESVARVEYRKLEVSRASTGQWIDILL